jgi:hypothetical protein
LAEEPEWYPAWIQLCDKAFGSGGYAGLSTDEQLWLNTRGLIDSIENGGLISFFTTHTLISTSIVFSGYISSGRRLC